MSRFHVGQMVEVIGPPGSRFLGARTTVRAVGQHGADLGVWFRGIEVDIDYEWLGGLYAVFQPQWLLPIDAGNPDSVETEEELSA